MPQSPSSSKFDDLLYTLSNDLIQLQEEETLGALRDAKPLVSGILLKMSRSYSNALTPSWKRRVVVLSRNARLHLFRPSAITTTEAIGTLVLSSCSGSFKETYNAHVLEVLGYDPTDTTQTHKWTFKCSDKETMAIWLESISTILIPSNRLDSSHLPEIKLNEALSRNNSKSSTIAGEGRRLNDGFQIGQRKSIAIDILQSQPLFEVSSDESTSNLETALSQKSLSLDYLSPRSSFIRRERVSGVGRVTDSGVGRVPDSVVAGVEFHQKLENRNEKAEDEMEERTTFLQRSLSLGKSTRKKISGLLKRSGSMRTQLNNEAVVIPMPAEEKGLSRRPSWKLSSLFKKESK
ncbi:UNVERIFIED_CONTAM: hypothetical protein HDU68_012275 [Siphonaria sp. JEL0065]|nr:hypothetical protein HDU68_012275 [Siphonaria sp. JEL0065]